jgi:hypothetical protein
MKDVCGKIEDYARTATAEPRDEESSFSLLAAPDRIALRPISPDEWMRTEGCVMKVPGSKNYVSAVDKEHSGQV